MSVSYCIAHGNDELLNTDNFIKQLRKKWPGIQIHFITDPRVHSLLQFRTPDDFWVDDSWILGDFVQGGVWYQANGLSNIAQFALWYCSIVPADWQLRYYDSGLYFHPMILTHETTEAEIIAGFDVSFDMSKYG